MKDLFNNNSSKGFSSIFNRINIIKTNFLSAIKLAINSVL